MPKGSKKRRAIKLRKETANNNSPSINSSGSQGDDHNSSDHALTEDEFSPRASSEAPPQHGPERETAVSEEASVVPVERQTVSESEPIGASTTVTSKVLESEQIVSESEQTEPSMLAASTLFNKPFTPVEEKSGEVNLHHEQTEAPESEQTEASMLAASTMFNKPFTLVEEKSGEVNLHHEQTEVPEAVSRDALTAETTHLLGRRSSWWNCCGLLDVFLGST